MHHRLRSTTPTRPPERRRGARIPVFVFLFCAAVAACPAAVLAEEVRVAVNDDYFAPAALDVNVGDTVIWINQGNHDHTATSGSGCSADGNWDSGAIPPGSTYSITFDQAGSFSYYCADFCENGMTGLVTVHQPSDLACPVGAIPGGGDAPLLVNFASMVTGGVAPFAFLWTFGDGGTDPGATVSYTYTAPGDYTWTLTVTDFQGAVCTQSGVIRLKSPRP
jgi:plastocyanin